MTEQGDRLDEAPEGDDARQAVLRLFRARRHPCAAPRARRMDRQVEGQVRPGLGQDPRGNPARQIAHGHRSEGHHSSPPSREAIKDWDKLSADEKRLFTRQVEMFAALPRLHRPPHRPRASRPSTRSAKLDNTLVFYIAGDNGTSAEGGMNGMFNEYTYFNGVQEKVDDMLKLIDKWGGPETYPHMAAGWAIAFNSPFTLGQTGRLELRRHPRRHGRPLAEGHPGQGRDPHAVQPCDRHRARPSCEAAGLPEPKVVNGTPQIPMEGKSLLVQLQRRQGRRTPHHAVLRNRRQPRGLPRRLACRHRPQGTVGDQAAPPLAGRCLGTLRRAHGLQPAPTTSPPKNPEKLKEMQAVFLAEAKKYHVLPIDDRVFERTQRRRCRPSRSDGRPHLADARRGHAAA